MAATIPYYTVDDLDRFPRDGNRYELLDRVLLVTPEPGTPHQLIVSRMMSVLLPAVQDPGHAFVLAPGVVSFPPGTQLEPDILVTPARFPVSERWSDVRDYWLAVEVYSRSSRIYDHDFKRDNYLKLGVKEVWLVDRVARSVEVSRELGASDVVNDVIVWRPSGLDVEVRVDLRAVFADV